MCNSWPRRVTAAEWSGPLTVSYLASTHCRSWVKRQFAAPTIRGILGVELPSPDMTVPVTDLPITERHATGSGGSIGAHCPAQSNVNFSPKPRMVDAESSSGQRDWPAVLA